jgi:hypothetical protein
MNLARMPLQTPTSFPLDVDLVGGSRLLPAGLCPLHTGHLRTLAARSLDAEVLGTPQGVDFPSLCRAPVPGVVHTELV